jgi:hypothetical protein
VYLLEFSIFAVDGLILEFIRKKMEDFLADLLMLPSKEEWLNMSIPLLEMGFDKYLSQSASGFLNVDFGIGITWPEVREGFTGDHLVKRAFDAWKAKIQ